MKNSKINPSNQNAKNDKRVLTDAHRKALYSIENSGLFTLEKSKNMYRDIKKEQKKS